MKKIITTSLISLVVFWLFSSLLFAEFWMTFKNGVSIGICWGYDKSCFFFENRSFEWWIK